MVGHRGHEASFGWGASGRAMLAVVLVVALVAAAWLVWALLLSPGARIASAEREFREAMRTERSTELRLSGLAYAPYRRDRAAGDVEDRLSALRDRLGALAAESANADVHHAYGRVLLASGRPAEALAELRAASALRPNDAEVLVDLAAAQAEAGDLAGALAVVERALRLEPGRADAVFNRALIEARLGNTGAARDDLNRYVAIDPGSGWADEARERLQGLNPSLGAHRDGIPRPDALRPNLFAVS